MSSNSTILLHLSLVDGVGPATIERIRTAFGDALSDMYQCTAHDLIERASTSRSMAAAVVAGLADTRLLENELVLMARCNISWVSINQDQYPQTLKNIHLPPPILFYQGNLDVLHKKSVAFVGSRGANQYGHAVVDMLVPELVQVDYAIISGGALGADAMAHNATLHAGGTTAAVIGSGLNYKYPRHSDKLFERILEQDGIIVTPFSALTKPMPGNFPARNRIIAGLSSCCVVVQAAARSGATITAQFALEQGKEVCAVPGSIFDSLSVGCHTLIQQGAHPVQNSGDILAILGDPSAGSTERIMMRPEQQMPKQAAPAAEPVAFTSPIHKEISDACRNPVYIDDLLPLINHDLATLNGILFDLQLQGVVEQTLAGQWRSL